MGKSCGIVNFKQQAGDGTVITFMNPTEEIIKWEKVSSEFKAKFMKTWKEHYEAVIINNSDDGDHMNWLCALDELGYYINEIKCSHITDTFNVALDWLPSINLQGKYSQDVIEKISCPMCGGKVTYAYGVARCVNEDWIAGDSKLEKLIAPKVNTGEQGNTPENNEQTNTLLN